jgi:hypothetical protein
MRIVALSDQHGHLPAIPPCDLLIVAGDICPDRFGPAIAMHAPERQQAWFDVTARPWLVAAPATHKVLTWGNHDWCGQLCNFTEDSPAVASAGNLQILVDEGTNLPGDHHPISIWATPWSNQFMRWAFMKPPEELARIDAGIPAGIDILVSHQPPYGYGDLCANYNTGRIEHFGSRELLAAIERVRPKLVFCGHMHEGFGRYEHEGIPIYNVSVVDDRYRLVHEPTVVDFPE